MASDDLHILKALISTPSSVHLELENIAKLLSSEPWVHLPGSFNARNLSSVPLLATSVRSGLIYRSGSLEALTPEGHVAIKALGIKTFFDLRSVKERQEFPVPAIDGVKVGWTPSTLDNETTPAAQAHKRGDGKPFSNLEIYTDMFVHARRSLRSRHQTHWNLSRRASLVCLYCRKRSHRRFSLHPGRPRGQQRGQHEHRIRPRQNWNGTGERIFGEKIVRRKRLVGGQDTNLFGEPEDEGLHHDESEYDGRAQRMDGSNVGGVVGYAKNELGLTEDEIEKTRAALRGEKG
jgi:Tyrosine phosphatase family